MLLTFGCRLRDRVKVVGDGSPDLMNHRFRFKNCLKKFPLALFSSDNANAPKRLIRWAIL